MTAPEPSSSPEAAEGGRAVTAPEPSSSPEAAEGGRAVSLDFLSLDGAAWAGGEMPVAHSPMQGAARAEDARFEVRDGWNVAVAYGSGSEAEAHAARVTAGWADVSHLGKLELQAPADRLEPIVAACTDGAHLELGRATRAADAWWCPLTPTRVLVICDPPAPAAWRERLDGAAGADLASVVDVTTNFAALTLVGPLAREVFARFSAIDLRPAKTPVGALRPGSIGRQPGTLICEAPDRYLFLFGWAIGEYMWSIVSDAGRHLGGRPIGLDTLVALPRSTPAQAAARA